MLSCLRFAFLLTTCLVFSAVSWAEEPPADDSSAPSAAEETTTEETTADSGDSADAGDDLNEDGTYDKTIRWATASEVDNFGYDIFRGPSEDGPFERLTEDPIAGAGTTDEPSYYTYIDEGLDPSRDYYYYIESISMHGERERFTPIQRVPARQPTEEPQD